ncbi:MAG: hypothetical protein LBE59_04110 [Nevskiaceae bacterium]|jgi:hypothetical protein|nr:hypothetical protein [Nevskiaceae bacterium]
MPKKRAAVIFVHGLAKKPPPERLEQIWLEGLELDDPRPDVFKPPNPGVKLRAQGVDVLFNYYADVFYGANYANETDSSDNADFEAADSEAAAAALENRLQLPGDLALPAAISPHEAEFLAAMEREMPLSTEAGPSAAAAAPAEPATLTPGQLEIAGWLPRSARNKLIKKFAMEAYYFLFNKPYTRTNADGTTTTFMVRDELRTRLITNLNQAQAEAEKIVLVTHSMGTMVGYDVLRNVAACPPVDLLITLGSPLGIKEVQDELRAEGARQVDFPAAKLNRWTNIYDPLDPICGFDPRFDNDYLPVNGKGVVDIREDNWGNWRHTITHYLAGKQFRAALADPLDINRP